MSNKANGAFGSELFNQSIPINGTQSNKTNQPLPTPKNTAKELSSGVPVSEHDRMTRMIQQKSAPVSPKEMTKGADLPADVLVPWAQMEKKADKALFLAQQGKQVNEIARLVGWSSGSVKTTFSSWKKKQLVDGRASNIKPMLHESHLPTFRHLFLVERIGKNAIIERYDFHPDVVDSAFYRLKREKCLSGSPENPVPLQQGTNKPVHDVSLPEARAIITDCFIEKKMNRDKIANVHPAVESFITTVFKELVEDGELLGTPMNPIVKTKVPEPVYQVGQKSAPPLREKEVTPKESFKPKFAPLPEPQPEPKSTAKADEAQIKKLKETLDDIDSLQAASKKSDEPPSSTKLTDVPPSEAKDEMDMDGFDESISEYFKEKRERLEQMDEREKNKEIIRSCFLEKGMNSIEIAKAHPDLTPFIHTVYDEIRTSQQIAKEFAASLRYGTESSNQEKSNAPLLPSDPTVDAVNEIVAHSHEDNPYVQALRRELEEERELSKRLTSEAKLQVPWEEDAKTKELKRQLDEVEAQLKSSVDTPADADAQDDGTFRHLVATDDKTHENQPANQWVVLNDKPFVSSYVQTEVGRLTLQESGKSIEEIQSHIDLLIQSLTVCGATHFAIDLTLKGQK